MTRLRPDGSHHASTPPARSGFLSQALSRAHVSLAALGGALLSVLVAAPVAAQIVNTQPLLNKVTDEGLSGELRGNVDWRTGNTDLLRVKTSLLALYRSGDHTLISSSKLDVGLSGGDEFVSRVFSHLRHQLRLSDLVTWEVFGQISTAKFKRLSFRGLAGTGPRWSLLTSPDLSLSLGTAYMFEHEELSSGSEADSDRAEDNHRASIYLSGRWTLAPPATLIHTTFYQPRLDAIADDFRLYSDTTLALSLNPGLAVTVNLEVAYDAAPPEGVKPLDTTLTFGLALGL